MRMTSVLLLLGFTWPALASAAQLRLTWEDTTPSEAGFLIERRMATEESFTPLTTVGVNLRITGQNPLQLPRKLQNLLEWQVLEKNHPEVLSQSP